ncbi:MAG TPA: cyclophilin-like family protein [Hyphomicrobium sp.]|jgi:hypothetical protein
MPTNILRGRNRAVKADKAEVRRRARKPQERRILITAGRVKVRAELLDTPTADRVWHALPLHSTAETWGQSIHFETPLESGRERNARQLAHKGDICFLVEDDRVIIAFGPTPISRPGELRLPRPCNLWARALDDVGVLKAVRPGEKVSVTSAED